MLCLCGGFIVTVDTCSSSYSPCHQKEVGGDGVPIQGPAEGCKHSGKHENGHAAL